jgi:hypothetical protein
VKRASEATIELRFENLHFSNDEIDLFFLSTE